MFSFEFISRKILIIASVITGILILVLVAPAITGYFVSDGRDNFSIETVAVCKELREGNCYYKCEDEVFMNRNGGKTSLGKTGNFVCHDKDWKDPRENDNLK